MGLGNDLVKYMLYRHSCNTVCHHQVFLIHHEALVPWSCISVWGGPVSEEVSGHTYPFCKAVGSYVSVIPPCGTKGHLSSHQEDQLQQVRCTQLTQTHTVRLDRNKYLYRWAIVSLMFSVYEWQPEQAWRAEKGTVLKLRCNTRMDKSYSSLCWNEHNQLTAS